VHPQPGDAAPETEFTTHYFWVIAYNRRLDDAEVQRDLFETVDRIFRTEDGPMVEEQQRAMGQTSDLLALNPVMLEPDAPAIRARRTLARLIADESRASVKAAARV
jgi:vanillate O-demethylase monooxygenase subunit